MAHRIRLISIIAMSVAACSDTPTQTVELLDLSGVWDFTEVLIRSIQPVVCRDTGSVSFDHTSGTLSGEGGMIGTCKGLLGTFSVGGAFEVEDGVVSDTVLDFFVPNACGCVGDGCDAHYIGTVSRGPPMRISGRSACSVNYNGTWEAVPAGAIASLALEPDSAEMVVYETIALTPVLRSTTGARLFQRALHWSSSDSSVVTVDEDGTVVAAGAGTATVTVASGGLGANSTVTARFVTLSSVEAGDYHTCAISNDGTPYCWGANDQGQSGPSPSLAPCPGVACRRAPGAVPSSVAFSVVSPGFQSTCGLGVGGQAYCWGTNSAGQLGVDLATARSPIPVEVSGGYAFTNIGNGTNHVCGVAVGGVARCWGYNHRGQLGPEGGGYSTLPVAVSTELLFASVSAGYVHSCGLSTDGRAYCWGWNYDRQLGVDSVPASEIPQLVSGNLTLTSLSVGWYHNCGLTGDGSVYCWGKGDEGQLGTDTLDFSATPVRLAGDRAYTAVSAGAYHTCAIGEDGSAHCWGSGDYGRLGNGSEEDSPTPVAVAGGLRFASISCGAEHTCGLTHGGVAYCWGSNFNGQVSGASVAPSTVPQKVVGQQ